MSDSDSATFVVRMVNQVTGPARAVQKSMGDVSRAFGDAQKKLSAPMPKRSALSDWDRMLSKAKLSQRSDFAKMIPKVPSAKKDSGGGGIMSTFLGVSGGEIAVGALKAVGAAALAAVESVGELVLKFIEAGLEAAAFAESSTKAIGFLTNNTLHAGQVFDDVRHLAQSLGLDVEDTIGSFQKLLAAQFTVGQSKGLIKMGADMRAIGASAEEVQRIIYAMSEIKSIGTLQKRQERMLQMAGLSGQLIDEQLMKGTGIKTKGGLDLARKKGLISSDVAIQAIESAVMAKTHEKALGDVGKERADNTLSGMLGKLMGAKENFWIDVGKKMQPGADRLAKMIAGTIGKVSDDPKVAGLGDFLLSKWERFTTWIVARWPTIENYLVVGYHAIGDAIEAVVRTVQKNIATFELIGAAMFGLALIAAVLALALGVVLLFVGLLAVAAIATGVIIGVGLAMITDQLEKWYKAGKGLIDALISGILAGLGPLGTAMALVKDNVDFSGKKPGTPFLPGSDDAAVLKALRAANPALAAAGVFADPSATTNIAPLIEGANASGIGSALSGLGDSKTEGGQKAASHTVTIASMPVHVESSADPQKQATMIGTSVRAELEKALKQL